jgi:hypothetical protein
MELIIGATGVDEGRSVGVGPLMRNQRKKHKSSRGHKRSQYISSLYWY